MFLDRPECWRLTMDRQRDGLSTQVTWSTALSHRRIRNAPPMDRQPGPSEAGGARCPSNRCDTTIQARVD